MHRAAEVEEALRRPGYLIVVPWEIEHPGGVNQVVTNLFDCLSTIPEYRPMILVASWEHLRVAKRHVAGRLTLYLRLRGPWRARAALWTLVKFVFALPRSMTILGSMCREHRIAVVNVHFPSPSALQFTILRKLRLFHGKIILSFHGTDLRMMRESEGLQRIAWSALLRDADLVVACSGSLADAIAESEPACAAKVAIVHNGVDIDQVRCLAAERRPSVGGVGFTYVISIATFEHKKGLDNLILAFASLTDAFPDLKLVIVGRSGPAKAELVDLVASQGLQEKVILVPDCPHANAIAWLAGARLFCLPSRAEPFGIAVLEAGACRVPVVASRVGGIPEIIDDGVSGRLVGVDDVAGLAAAIQCLLTDASQRERFADNLFRRVCAEFSWASACHKYVALANGLGRA